MRERNWTLMAALVVATGLAGGCRSMHAGGAAKAAPEMPTEAQMMEAWQAYMTPGQEHQRMAAQDGEWRVESKTWMAGPDAPPETTTGTATFRMTLGGRYQVQEWSGSMMDMPFQGFGLTGYDNATHEFTSVWVDSMGTGTGVSKGRRRADGSIELTGDMVDPMGNSMPTRIVLTDRGADSMYMEMFGSHPMHGPGEHKMMELVYTRVK